MGAVKTISIANHFGNLDFVLYSDEGILLQGKAKLLGTFTTKYENALNKKISLLFKYDKTGILSVKRGEVILQEKLKQSTGEEETTENSYAMDVKT